MAAIVCEGLRRDTRCGLGLGWSECFCLQDWLASGAEGTVYALDMRKQRYTDGSFYNYGLSKPNYPVPSTLGAVHFDGYPGQVYIDHPDGDDYIMCWDTWGGDMLIHYGE